MVAQRAIFEGTLRYVSISEEYDTGPKNHPGGRSWARVCTENRGASCEEEKGAAAGNSEGKPIPGETTAAWSTLELS